MTDYAYQPLEDSFFGKLIGKVLQDQGISQNEVSDSICSNLINSRFGGRFVGTPKAEKQIVMNILPEKFRKWILDKNYQPVKEEFRRLAFGDQKNPKPRIDVAMEILEWIFAGFSEDRLFLELIEILTGSKIQLKSNFISQLRIEYERAFQETI